MNLFYRIFTNAEKGRNAFKALSYDWTVVPGRDKHWEEQERKNIGADRFEQEYNVLFLGSSNTLIAPSSLKNIIYEDPIEVHDSLAIWELPQEKHKYIITVDVAEGIGLDASTFSVFDVTEKPYKIVARFRNNKEHVLSFPNPIYSVARKYNMAYVLIEVNGIGMQVADSLLNNLNYEHIFYSEILPGANGQKASITGGRNKKPGVKMSNVVKRVGCANIKDLIENQTLLLKDFDTVVELSNFVKVGDNFRAKEGETDDLVMTLVLFGWLAKQPIFEEMTNTTIFRSFKKEEDKIHIPFPIRYNYAEHCEQYGRNGFIDKDGTVWQDVTHLPIGIKE